MVLGCFVVSCGAWAPASHVQVSPAPTRQAMAIVKYDKSWKQEGIASYYAHKFHGRRTASGRIYNMHERVAAHRNLPFGTVVRVTNLGNGKRMDLEIVDRGPFIKGRIIDVSLAAAKYLDFIKQGTTKVKLEIVKPAK
ncbi:MAG: septal ring lytic transglycosylase RlpA family protein [candidate division KSB1 bacterium]|nr:septal ring lytic transglycosylase RlpA family protein [candidate division KSB1 bacterium]